MDKNIYDRKKAYDRNILPIIKKLKIMCIEYKIPMYVSCAVKNTDKKTYYENDIVMACTELHLTENRINKLMLRFNNFDTEYPQYVKNAIGVLQKYLDDVENVKNEASYTDENIALADDMIEDYMLIGDGLKDVTPSKDMLKK